VNARRFILRKERAERFILLLRNKFFKSAPPRAMGFGENRQNVAGANVMLGTKPAFIFGVSLDVALAVLPFWQLVSSTRKNGL